MSIPKNISKDHILKAIQRIDLEGIPKRRNSLKYFLRYNNKNYPVKLIISWANVFPNKEELDTSPNIFNSITAINYLKGLGFNTQ